MENHFELIAKNIKERRTYKVQLMNGEKISDQDIKDLLALADTAPTHGRTEPWRFTVFTGEGLKRFCQFHADTYWNETDENIRAQSRYDLFQSFYQHASHLVVVAMKRTEGVKIPSFEEYAACAAATQNILLGAEAKGLACIWNTGGKTYADSMKKFLALGEEDQVVGLVYIGKVDEIADKSAQRRIPLEDKIAWHNS